MKKLLLPLVLIAMMGLVSCNSKADVVKASSLAFDKTEITLDGSGEAEITITIHIDGEKFSGTTDDLTKKGYIIFGWESDVSWKEFWNEKDSAYQIWALSNENANDLVIGGESVNDKAFSKNLTIHLYKIPTGMDPSGDDIILVPEWTSVASLTLKVNVPAM
ncbi:hypothetical protein PVA44_05110 [Entomospira nematocerorum]|uniref:Uncharacterized protein n=1 Tax=Entomospira nematocerorum TaxID=2719987 RepID=A0A968GC93_9SPIO|nr:hypothetical protein [Entomospira nematocera]NIZ46599.1 hypothetical protein [Entomospira nematocera]WDI33603.1 hypothetical protein PVA44_05110 [Entomospira nematocera]